MDRDRLAALACLVLAVLYFALIPSQTSSRPVPGARGMDRLNSSFLPRLTAYVFGGAAIGLLLTSRRRHAGAADTAGAGVGMARDGSHARGEGVAGAQVEGLDLEMVFAEEDRADDERPLTAREFVAASAVVACSLLYTFLLPWVGYIVSTGLFGAAMSLWYARRDLPAYVLTAAVFPLCIYYLFAGVFYVPLPVGEWFKP